MYSHNHLLPNISIIEFECERNDPNRKWRPVSRKPRLIIIFKVNEILSIVKRSPQIHVCVHKFIINHEDQKEKADGRNWSFSNRCIKNV